MTRCRVGGASRWLRGTAAAVAGTDDYVRSGTASSTMGGGDSFRPNDNPMRPGSTVFSMRRPLGCNRAVMAWVGGAPYGASQWLSRSIRSTIRRINVCRR